MKSLTTKLWEPLLLQDSKETSMGESDGSEHCQCPP
jgi:hypothetical protein